MKKLLILLLLVPSLSWGEHKFDDYEKNESEFIKDVKDNDYMQHGVWLEFRSLSDPTAWNKIFLIFAYGKWGNFDECMNILKNTYPMLLGSNNARCQEVK